MTGPALRYLSVCSGIEAATQAWHPLGWIPAAFSEIEPFPSAVLAHHYPHVPNLGDMTRHKEWNLGTIDLLVGGTPCQSFSVAGLRKGLADPRGNLALTYLAIAAQRRPRWIVWENVPGVLSSNKGRDFGAFLGGLGQLGYGFAYRVLDAQYCRTRQHPWAVPQRRRRVFVVGYLGDWRRAAAVLFDRDSLSGHPAPGRETRQGSAAGAETGFGGGRRSGPVEAAATLTARGHKCDFEVETFVAHALTASRSSTQCPNEDATMIPVAHSLRGEGFDASEDGPGRGTPLVPAALPIDTTHITSRQNGSNPQWGDPCHSLASGAHPPAVAFSSKDFGGDAMSELSPTLRAGGHAGSHANAGNPPGVTTATGVRRLTPVECERLQAFPDDFTRIPWRGKPADLCPDGPRYKALGNSMAVNVMEWIGERIALVEAMP